MFNISPAPAALANRASKAFSSASVMFSCLRPPFGLGLRALMQAMCARFTVLSDTPIAAAIAGWAIPLSRNNTIWMRWRCAAGIFQRNAVFSRRTSALLHLTICFPRIRWRKRITPRARKIAPDYRPRIPIQAVMEAVLDIATVDLFAQLLDQIGNALQVRVDGERTAERVEGAFVVAELLQDDPQSRERAEMARLACQHFVDVGERAAEVFFRVVDGGAAVPRLGEVRPNVDDGGEQPDRKIVVLAVGRAFGSAHQEIGGIAAGGEPDRPDAVLDIFCAFVVGRDFERREQPIEVLRLVAALGVRQRAGRLDRLEWLGIDRFRRRRQYAGSRQHRGRHPCEESLAHALKPSAPQQHDKDKISSGQLAASRAALNLGGP